MSTIPAEPDGFVPRGREVEKQYTIALIFTRVTLVIPRNQTNVSMRAAETCWTFTRMARAYHNLVCALFLISHGRRNYRECDKDRDNIDFKNWGQIFVKVPHSQVFQRVIHVKYNSLLI